MWLFRALCALGQHTSKRRRKCTKQSRSCLYLCHIFTDFKLIFTHRLSNKPFLIWLLTTPPYLNCVVSTLPCNLSLMACFADTNVSQGSVATHARCGETFNIHLTANLLRNLPVKEFLKSVKNWQNYGDESVAPFFWPTLYSSMRLRASIYAVQCSVTSWIRTKDRKRGSADFH